ncbi:hypothetical protein L211DRAFT_854418 [Terfezia boudieri ATCC MYA-4762]|uniref:Uncharacterized protein n=1 Tax=Terfezia boudieri ATCC MYA-4762 TaxID=1051890 RepID=A0A3N4LJN6_9PEZI|nr:hypothetical protein L211DRAFT_854418 [Terfezia boudieri ATCC MYA-4762]
MSPTLKVTVMVERLSASGGPATLLVYKTINTTLEGNGLHIYSDKTLELGLIYYIGLPKKGKIQVYPYCNCGDDEVVQSPRAGPQKPDVENHLRTIHHNNSIIDTIDLTHLSSSLNPRPASSIKSINVTKVTKPTKSAKLSPAESETQPIVYKQNNYTTSDYSKEAHLGPRLYGKQSQVDTPRPVQIDLTEVYQTQRKQQIKINPDLIYPPRGKRIPFQSCKSPQLTKSQEEYLQKVFQWLLGLGKNCLVCSLLGCHEEQCIDFGTCIKHLEIWPILTFENFLKWKGHWEDGDTLTPGTACYVCYFPWILCNPSMRNLQAYPCSAKDTLLPLLWIVCRISDLATTVVASLDSSLVTPVDDLDFKKLIVTPVIYKGVPACMGWAIACVLYDLDQGTET